MKGLFHRKSYFSVVLGWCSLFPSRDELSISRGWLFGQFQYAVSTLENLVFFLKNIFGSLWVVYLLVATVRWMDVSFGLFVGFFKLLIYFGVGPELLQNQPGRETPLLRNCKGQCLPLGRSFSPCIWDCSIPEPPRRKIYDKWYKPSISPLQ